jgi:hypothetical protein
VEFKNFVIKTLQDAANVVSRPCEYLVEAGRSLGAAAGHLPMSRRYTPNNAMKPTRSQ